MHFSRGTRKKDDNAVMPPPEARPATTVVVIGGSAGALGALRDILSTFPAELDAAVLVVLHTTPTGRGYLAGVLERTTPMHVGYPVGLEPLLNGRVYVAPPDRHLQITGHCVETTTEAQEHHTRPAVDVLFRSAARGFGRRVIAVVLSGNGDDGSAGVTAVHAQGGVVIVQAPSDALYDSMPRCALDVVAVNHILPAALISRAVQRALSAVDQAA